MTDSKLGFEYIEGDDELPGFALAQLCCGKTVGCCKAWVPCLGCFCCCCNNPYVSVPQGSKGLLLRYCRSDPVSRSTKGLAVQDCTS